ncbi:hypothetical protein QWA_18192 [Alcaligenes faecalis subsp. faecalis NCIB 8687]|nr:hypothetical protein QWA_18192 [Alcaligenes faecalis subsp. faecalis NCIB 8687]
MGARSAVAPGTELESVARISTPGNALDLDIGQGFLGLFHVFLHLLRLANGDRLDFVFVVIVVRKTQEADGIFYFLRTLEVAHRGRVWGIKKSLA